MSRILDPPAGAARSESGMAMVVLLVVVLFVALVGVAMMNNTVSEVQIAVNESNAIQARDLAEAGIADAANHLSVDNTWTGPVTQTLGPGTYTVQVNTARSNSAVKAVVSTGQVLAGTPSSGRQTVTETLLVLPQAFSKALMTDTTAVINTAGANGATPTVTNTVLRQLGTLHANNTPVSGKSPATTAVSQASGTEIVGQLTASGGTGTNATLSLKGTCIACAPSDNQPAIPFPTFNWSHYTSLAQNNPSPCPGFSSKTYTPTNTGAGGFGTYFTIEGDFDGCVSAITADAQGFRTLNGVIFFNDTANKGLTLPNVSQEAFLKINGTLAVYNTTASGCDTLHVCGNAIFAVPTSKIPTQDLIFTAQNGEPAIMVGGGLYTASTGCNSTASPGTITINGLVYLLAGTADSTQAQVPSPGYCLNGSPTARVTITGALVANIVGSGGIGFSNNSLTYDPSTFFPGLPSGLISPGPPFVLLPISWSSGE